MAVVTTLPLCRIFQIIVLALLSADCVAQDGDVAETSRQTVKGLPAAVAANTDNLNDKFWLYLPERYAESKEKLPLIIYLHGSSRRGREVEQVKANGLPPVLDDKDDFDFIVASPQALAKYPWQQCWEASIVL